MKLKINVEMNKSKNNRINNTEVLYCVSMKIVELDITMEMKLIAIENNSDRKYINSTCQMYGNIQVLQKDIEEYERIGIEVIKKYWKKKNDFMNIDKLEDTLRENIVYVIKEDIFANMKKNLEKELLWNRFESKEALEKVLGRYGIKKLNEVDESGLVADYAFIGAVDEEGYGYVDIYYLKIPYGEDRILVTGVEVNEE